MSKNKWLKWLERFSFIMLLVSGAIFFGIILFKNFTKIVLQTHFNCIFITSKTHLEYICQIFASHMPHIHSPVSTFDNTLVGEHSILNIMSGHWSPWKVHCPAWEVTLLRIKGDKLILWMFHRGFQHYSNFSKNLIFSYSKVYIYTLEYEFDLQPPSLPVGTMS